MITRVRKRNNEMAPFEQEKIAWALYKAAEAVGGSDFDLAHRLSEQVVRLVPKEADGTAFVEDIQDTAEKVLIENGHAKTAKAFILYREKRRSARE
ncbi:MAG: ribonucleoside triphosphate reductase, partial [Clostridiales Family XIII bacterium]|nr:ribonucleoside triphosphate reductase [Clostridiales Family XIII bacterium]